MTDRHETKQEAEWEAEYWRRLAEDKRTPPDFRTPVQALWAAAPNIVARRPVRGWRVAYRVALVLCLAIAGAAIYFGFRGAPL